MTSERWAAIKQVFGDALELPAAERPAFLESACGSDPELRREVERLLEAEGGTLHSPVSGVVAQLATPDLAPGAMLGHYRVEGKIGQGGMGSVYRAMDTRLERRVALKVLPPELFRDPSLEQRFLREARAASGLMHPNIVTVHDVGSERGIHFIAMEFVEGRSLDQAIPATGLPVKQALGYAVQIAGALASAHAAGIVHRDLKPGNIMITREGLVKLLDFGLARKTGVAAGEGSGQFTVEGAIVGTPSYMSPEQVRGEPVDHRSDIFSFGSVLYEMVTGRRPFDGGTAVESMNAILTAEPPEMREPGRAVPFAVESIILHCLEKEPQDRFQSARDLGYALEASAGPSTVTQAIVPAPKSARRNAVWIGALAACFVIGALAAFLWASRSGGRISVDGLVFAPITAGPGAELFPSLSPDGNTVAYASKAAGNWDIYLRRVGTDDSVNLTKDSQEDDTQPAFSPDGRQIAFRSDRQGGGIFLMRADGSGVKKLADAGYNPAWSPDGKQILYAEEGILRPEDRATRLSQMWAVETATGKKRLVSKTDAVQPQWSPTGRYIAYWAIDLDAHRDIWTVPAGGGHAVRITRDEYLNWNPVWSHDGSFLYFISNRGGATGIWRVPIREATGEARGAPEPVRTPAPYTAHLSFSRDGRRMAYVHQVTTGHLSTVRFDPDREALVSEPKEILHSADGASRPALSPDGNWLAFNSTEGEEDIYVVNVDGSGLRQITGGHFRNRGPRWAPDGKSIAYFSTRSGDWEIWAMAPDGSAQRQITNLAGQNVAWPVWSPDNKYLAYTIFGVNTFLIGTAKPWNAQKPQKLPPYPSGGHLFNAWSWSPDGRTVAGFLNRGEGIALYYPATQTFRKVTDTGADPIWLSDSRRLLFHDRGRINLLDSESGRVSEILSIAPEEIARRGFAISPDDRHIYFSESRTEADIWMVQFER